MCVLELGFYIERWLLVDGRAKELFGIFEEEVSA